MKRAQQKAFTMIELIVVIALIGVITMAILPRLFRPSPTLDWPHVLIEMNNLVFFARQEAINNSKVYRLTFLSKPNIPDTVTVEEESDDPEKLGRKIYKQVSSYYISTKYTFPVQIKIKAVYLGKLEQLAENRGQAYCYVSYDGLVQDVLVQLVRKTEGFEMASSYKMNPFFGKFEFHDGLVKPER